jgi:putative tryptophan/tyrosine transport system substrate-binding protein
MVGAMKRREFIAALAAAPTWLLPVRALAQPLEKSYRITVVSGALVTDMNEDSGHPAFRALFPRLRQLGLIEGTNLSVQRYSFLGLNEPFTELAGEIVRQKPDVIFAVTGRMVRALKEATATIPIVGVVADPLASGIVTSLARPGGNVTGVSTDAGIEVLAIAMQQSPERHVRDHLIVWSRHRR